jgi:hypothetical protein
MTVKQKYVIIPFSSILIRMAAVGHNRVERRHISDPEYV